MEPQTKWPVDPEVLGTVSPEDPEMKTSVSVNAVQAVE